MCYYLGTDYIMNEGSKLNEEELYKIFKSLQVPIRQSDLKNPTVCIIIICLLVSLLLV